MPLATLGPRRSSSPSSLPWSCGCSPPSGSRWGTGDVTGLLATSLLVCTPVLPSRERLFDDGEEALAHYDALARPSRTWSARCPIPSCRRRPTRWRPVVWATTSRGADEGGTGCSSGAFRVSRVERRRTPRPGSAAHSCAAGCSSHSPVATALAGGSGVGSAVHDRAVHDRAVHDRQAPGPAGELAGDRGHPDRGAFPAGVPACPASVQATVAPLGRVSDRGWLAVASAISSRLGR